MSNFATWVATVEGKYIDEDGVFGSQCVDVAINYVKFLGANYRQVLGTGNAKDLWGTSSPDFFRKINYSAGLIPQPGDIAIWNAYASNPYGHIAVVLDANSQGMLLMEQDGFIDVDKNGNADGVAYRKFRYYGNNLIGWLRPKGETVAKFTKEQVQSFVYASTGANPGPNFNYAEWVGQDVTDASLNALAQRCVQWHDQYGTPALTKATVLSYLQNKLT